MVIGQGISNYIPDCDSDYAENGIINKAVGDCNIEWEGELNE